MQYNRARYFDSAVGRWISEDPIGFLAGDTNLNRYVANDPSNRTDPTGLDETLFTARGQVAHEAIQEEVLKENESAAKEVETVRNKPKRKQEGRYGYDVRRNNQKIEIGPASTTGVRAKLKDVDSLPGTNKRIIFYESLPFIPKKGESLRYVELKPNQARLIQN